MRVVIIGLLAIAFFILGFFITLGCYRIIRCISNRAGRMFADRSVVILKSQRKEERLRNALRRMDIRTDELSFKDVEARVRWFADLSSKSGGASLSLLRAAFVDPRPWTNQAETSGENRH